MRRRAVKAALVSSPGTVARTPATPPDAFAESVRHTGVDSCTPPLQVVALGSRWAKMLPLMASIRATVVRGVLLLLAACSATGYPISDLATEINGTLDRSQPRLRPGDALSVTFPYKAEWNHSARVRADGIATFLIAGEVQVVGLTLAELAQQLTPRFEGQVLTVDLVAPAGLGGADGGGGGGAISPMSAFVVGEVQSPGPVDLTGRTFTLFEIIAAAGGHLKATANLGNTILVRRMQSGELRSWRLDADIYDWGNLPAIYLQPRDIVFVPNTAIDEVDIWIDQYIRQLIPIPFPVIPIR